MTRFALVWDISEFALAEGRPSEIQLLYVGPLYRDDFPGGKINVTPKMLEQMVENFQRRTPEVVIDYQHSSLDSNPQNAIAAGWIKGLEVRNGGKELWARVEWNERAREYIEAGEYRYISPEFTLHLKDETTGRAVGAAILAAALTNRPFIKGLAPVMLAEGVEAVMVIRATEWTAAYVNDLPDSSFAHISPGGEKDEGGKTTPRSLRHLPYRDRDGKPDLPHVRNALARLNQAKDIPAATKEKIRAMLQRILEKEGKEGDEKAMAKPDKKGVLPDAAYACIDQDGGKHFPHHTAEVDDGDDHKTVDRALLKEGMAQCMDDSYDLPKKMKEQAHGHMMTHAKALGIKFSDDQEEKEEEKEEEEEDAEIEKLKKIQEEEKKAAKAKDKGGENLMIITNLRVREMLKLKEGEEATPDGIGVVLMEGHDRIAALEASCATLKEANEKLLKERRIEQRDAIIAAAIRKGTVLASERKGLVDLFDIDFDKAKAAVEGRTTRLIDLSERGLDPDPNEAGDSEKIAVSIATKEKALLEAGRKPHEALAEAQRLTMAEFGAEAFRAYRANRKAAVVA